MPSTSISSPRSVNTTFKNISHTHSSTTDFNNSITEITKTISELINIAFLLGKSKSDKIKYKKKSYTKEYLKEVVKQLKENIKNIPNKNNKVNTNIIKEKNKEVIKEYAKKLLDKNYEGKKAFFNNFSREIPGIMKKEANFEGKTNLENFFNNLIIENVKKRIKKYEAKNKKLGSLNFSLDKPFTVCDEFVNFLKEANMGNTFYYLFGRKESMSNDIILNGKIKENIPKILKQYSTQIKENEFLSKIPVNILELIANPNFFFYPTLIGNYMTFSGLIVIINHYIRINNLKSPSDKRKIKLDDSLKKLMNLKSISIDGEEKKSEVVDVKEKEIEDEISLLNIFKVCKKFIIKRDNKVDENTLKHIENYIFFTNKNIF